MIEKRAVDDEKRFGKYLLAAIVIALVFISYRIISPFIIILISAFVFSYLVLPLYKIFNKKLGSGFSAILCIILMFLVLIIPIALITTQISIQASNSLQNGYINSMVEKLTGLEYLKELNLDVSNLIENLTLFVFSVLSGFLTKLPSIILSTLIFVFSSYFMLINWESLTQRIKNFIPFKNKNQISEEIDRSTHAIVFGYLLVAIIEFIIVSIALYFAGSNLYFLLAFFVAIMVFIPGLGPVLVMLPLSIYYFLTDNFVSLGIVLGTWFVIAFLVETLLLMKILGDKSKINPIIMLLGVIGGTSMFGFFGFILGPLVLVYTLKLLEGISREI